MGRIKGKPITWVDMGFKENTFNQMNNNGEMRDLEIIELADTK